MNQINALANTWVYAPDMANHTYNASSAFNRATRQNSDSIARLSQLAEAQYHATLALVESNQQILEVLRKKV